MNFTQVSLNFSINTAMKIRVRPMPAIRGIPELSSKYNCFITKLLSVRTKIEAANISCILALVKRASQPPKAQINQQNSSGSRETLKTKSKSAPK